MVTTMCRPGMNPKFRLTILSGITEAAGALLYWCTSPGSRSEGYLSTNGGNSAVRTSGWLVFKYFAIPSRPLTQTPPTQRRDERSHMSRGAHLYMGRRKTAHAGERGIGCAPRSMRRAATLDAADRACGREVGHAHMWRRGWWWRRGW